MRGVCAGDDEADTGRCGLLLEVVDCADGDELVDRGLDEGQEDVGELLGLVVLNTGEYSGVGIVSDLGQVRF